VIFRYWPVKNDECWWISGIGVFIVRSILLGWFFFDKNLPVVVAGLFRLGWSLIETVRFASVRRLTHTRRGFSCFCFCACGLQLASLVSEGVDLCSCRASIVGGSRRRRVFLHVPTLAADFFPVLVFWGFSVWCLL
jgi:hypothetical protein